MMNPMEISLADEVRKTLQAECYGAALALALTIPDAYGQIAFRKRKSREKIHGLVPAILWICP